MMTPEENIVFAVSPREGGADLILGISRAAWEYMRQGQTHTMDLTKLGLPIRLIVFGGADHAEIRAAIDAHNAHLGLETEDQTDRNFGIKEGPPSA